MSVIPLSQANTARRAVRSVWQADGIFSPCPGTTS